MPTDVVSLALESSGFDRVLSSMRNFADQQIGLGSSAGDTRFLRFLGNAMGFNPAGLARGAYQNSLAGMGLIANQRAGNPLQFDQLQPVDYGKRLINLIEKLVEIEDKYGHDAARLFATQADIQDALKITLLSPASRREYMSQLRRQSDPAFAAQQAEFEFSKSSFLDTFSQRLMPLSKFMLEVGELFFRNAFRFGRPDIPERMYGGGGGGASGSGMNANTKALNDLAQELRHTQGIFGGGRRARRAIPGAFGPGWGGFLPEALRSQTVRLGAYSVSM